MADWLKFCEEKTATISVSSSASCDADSLTVIDIHIDTRKMTPCPKGTVLNLSPQVQLTYMNCPLANLMNPSQSRLGLVSIIMIII